MGAGKSTWLRHQLFAKAYENPHVIVNEVAASAVDDILLAGAQRLDVLAGGCVCCDQRQKMIDLLHRICNERSRPGKPDSQTPHQLIFEMSGVADPAKVMTTIQSDPILCRHIVLTEIVVVVDALHGLEQLRSETLSRRQIESADRLLVTKIDKCDPEKLAVLLATLRLLNPTPRIHASIFGVKVPMPELPSAAPLILPEIDGLTEEPIISVQLNLNDFDPDGLNWTGFSVWLSAMLHTHGDRMVRVKGIVKTPAGRLLLQSVRKTMQAPEILPVMENSGAESGEISDNVVNLIGRGLDPSQIDRSLRYFMELPHTTLHG